MASSGYTSRAHAYAACNSLHHDHYVPAQMRTPFQKDRTGALDGGTPARELEDGRNGERGGLHV